MGGTFSKLEDPHEETLRCDEDLNWKTFPKSSGHTLRPDSDSDREIGYEIYGSQPSEALHTLLYFHGTPGSRFFFSSEHDTYADKHKVCVIVPERPGFGLSSADETRTIRSGSMDAMKVLSHVTNNNNNNNNNKNEVHVVGYSAGGPYALAFAYDFPKYCKSVAIISSLSPNVRGILSNCDLISRIGYTLAVYSKSLLTLVVQWFAKQSIKTALEGKRDDFTDEENETFLEQVEIRRVFAKSTLELYSRACGAKAEAMDYVLMARDWGFHLNEIDYNNFDIWIYGGGKDRKCTPRMYDVIVDQLTSSSSANKIEAKENKRVKKVFIEEENHLYFFKLFTGRLFEDLGIVPCTSSSTFTSTSSPTTTREKQSE